MTPVPAAPALPVEPPWQKLCWPPQGRPRNRPLVLPPLDLTEALPEGIEIGYRGVWDTQSEQIDAYLCTVAAPRGRPGPQWPGGDGESPVTPGSRALPVLDLALLFASLEQMTRNIEARCRVMMIVPLRYACLVPPFIDSVVAILRYFPDPARARYLLLELVDCPRGLRPAEITALGQRLRPLGRDLLLRYGPTGPDRRTLEVLRPLALGIARDPELPLLDLRPLRGTYRSYVWGVDDAESLDVALSEGHWRLAGDALSPAVPVPLDALPLPRSRLTGGG